MNNQEKGELGYIKGYILVSNSLKASDLSWNNTHTHMHLLEWLTFSFGLSVQVKKILSVLHSSYQGGAMDTVEYHFLSFHKQTQNG